MSWWLGLQKILENSVTVPMVVYLYPRKTSDLFRAERRPDVFIWDLGTERDALSTINKILEIRPPGISRSRWNHATWELLGQVA